MREIDKILSQIEEAIRENKLREFETERIELKDLSSGGDFRQLYITTCAFLNTTGGIIVVGIKENPGHPKAYKLTGYNPDTEAKIKDLPNQFTDDSGAKLALTDYFPTFEIKEILDKQICLVFVEKLPEDIKYAFYNGKAYERKLTGDHEISKEQIQQQRERREDLSRAREIQPVERASLDDLNVDKLNDYIIRLNRDVKVESLKPDIRTALPFLSKKYFVLDHRPTLLGMLVCGDYIYNFIGGRCQVDGFVDSPIHIVQDKQVLKDNIIPLLERSINFVFKNIQVGISVQAGGQSKPEYPEKLIRETINNALAHRDYSIDKFVNVIIKPNEHIEIRNPGSFRSDQTIRINDAPKVRRIVPNPQARNPRLADILKSFDRWEGRGLGMASLTNACLDNEIDLPYFVFNSENEIRLFIPKGRVFDEGMKVWINSFSRFIANQNDGRELTEEQQIALAYFLKSEQLNALEKYTILLTPDNNHFDVIRGLEDNGLIERHPQSPQLYPIYVVHRELTKTNFDRELREVFGEKFDHLSNEYKDVLGAVYQHNRYSKESVVSAKQINNYLYFQKNSVVSNIKEYDNFYRRIRNIFNKLEKNLFIFRPDGKSPRFVINTRSLQNDSLFG